MRRITDPVELATYRRSRAPQLAQHVRCKTGDAEAWIYAQHGRYYAVGFLGRAQNPHDGATIWFRTAEARAAWVTRLFATATAEHARRQKRQADKSAARAKPHGLAVGDVLRSVWGYDQTNVDYYQVTKLIGTQMVEYRRIGALSEETHYMQGDSAPAPGAFIGPAKRARVSEHGARNSIRVSSCANASKLEPTRIAGGVNVYEPSRWTSYA